MILYEIVDRLKDEVDPKTVYLAYPHQHSERQTTLADILENPEAYEAMKSNKIKRICFNGGNIWLEMKQKKGQAVKGFADKDSRVTIRDIAKRIDFSQNTDEDPKKMAVYNANMELLQVYDLTTYARALQDKDKPSHIGAPSFCFMGEVDIIKMWTERVSTFMPCLCVQIDAAMIVPDDLY